jgi:hypothetical protein
VGLAEVLGVALLLRGFDTWGSSATEANAPTDKPKRQNNAVRREAFEKKAAEFIFNSTKLAFGVLVGRILAVQAGQNDCPIVP